MEGIDVSGHAVEDKAKRWCHPEDPEVVARITRIWSRYCTDEAHARRRRRFCLDDDPVFADWLNPTALARLG
jgi:hypothetical protein